MWVRHRTALSLVAVLLGIISATQFLKSASRDATEGSVSSVGANQPVETDWQPIIARGKYETFRKLTKLLRDGKACSDAIAAYRSLIRNEACLARIEQWIAKLDGPQRAQALKALYSELMRADSDPDILYECAEADIDNVFHDAAKRPLRYGMYFSWGLSRPLTACLIGYEATGQIRFLELIADTFERTLPLRDSALGRMDEVRGRVMNSWGTDKYSLDGRYSAEVTTAGRVTFPIARWIKIVRDNPELSSHFGDRPERYLAIIRETMEEFASEYRTIDEARGGYFLHLTKNVAEPLNHMASAGNSLLALWEITGDMRYHDMAVGIANYFRAAMWRDESGCLVWKYWPQPNTPKEAPGEYVWKARITIELPLYFEQQGTVFTSDDLEAVVRMFLTNVYRSDGRWSARITSDFADLDQFPDKGGGLLCVSPFIQLDRYDPKIREVIEELVATRTDAGGWLNQTHGIIAYAHRLKPIK